MKYKGQLVLHYIFNTWSPIFHLNIRIIGSTFLGNKKDHKWKQYFYIVFLTFGGKCRSEIEEALRLLKSLRKNQKNNHEQFSSLKSHIGLYMDCPNCKLSFIIYIS